MKMRWMTLVRRFLLILSCFTLILSCFPQVETRTVRFEPNFYSFDEIAQRLSTETFQVRCSVPKDRPCARD